MVTATVTGLGHAVPPALDQSELWEQHFRAAYDDDRTARRIWASSGVARRHGVVDPRSDDVSTWSTGRRMARFLPEALPLGKEAALGALDRAGVRAGDIGLFAVVSCTGYATPGLDVLLARDLGMAPSVQRLAIGHMGCYAALPGLGAVADHVAARDRSALLLCLELPSLHAQPVEAMAGRPTTDQVEQLVAHALFSDAATALVVQPGGGPGLDVVDVVARTDVGTADHMTWSITDHGFRMTLSSHVPRVLEQHVLGVVEDLLHAHGLRASDVTEWVVHPGGPRILDVVRDKLGLDEERIRLSRDVLRDYGNCSSATVPLILEQVVDAGVDPGAYVVALAFGPGLTLYAALLRGR